MNNPKKGIWFPLTLVSLVAVIALWYPLKYGHTFLYNRRLLNDGVLEYAQIVQKGILVDNDILWEDNTTPEDNHQFQVRLTNGNINPSLCRIGISKSLFDRKPTGIKIPVLFLRDEPQNCKLSWNLPVTQKVLLAGLGLSSFMLLFALGAVYSIRRAYKKPDEGNPNKLTTKIQFEHPMNCPQCNEKMIEGYMPMGFGIHWRKIDHPVGIPSIFSVLPGTIFWFKRPKLHAYHCEKCKIVTFQYGNGKK